MVTPIQYQGLQDVTRKPALPGTPPQATSAEDRDMQLRALSQVERNSVVVIEYVNAALGIADAREIVSGEQVSLNRNTAGVELSKLEVGAKLMAFITRFHHAARVSPVPR